MCVGGGGGVGGGRGLCVCVCVCGGGEPIYSELEIAMVIIIITPV